MNYTSRGFVVLCLEDRGLLTPNTINEIRTRHQNDGFGDRSMYDYYKLYFDISLKLVYHYGYT